MLRVKTVNTITPRSLLVVIPKFMVVNWDLKEGDKVYNYLVEDGTQVLSTPTEEDGELISESVYNGKQLTVHVPVAIAHDKWRLTPESSLEVYVTNDAKVCIKQSRQVV